MGTHRWRFILLLAFVVLLLTSTDSWAWGPATHVKLAGDLLGQLSLLPAGLAALLAKHRNFFIYGNVATDTVFAKKMSKIKQICHHWATGFSLLDTARTDEGRAFAYGYLCHLAADTVAHNKFLPRQMAVSRSTIAFGHLYWEIRADALIQLDDWQLLRHTLRGSYEEPEVLLQSHLRETLLSFKTNRLLFKRMNLLASERAWRKSVDFWAKLSRFQLERPLVEDYHQESMERLIDVLVEGRSSAVLHEDPNGNSSLAYARAQRRQLQQMRRAGMAHHHVIHEATKGHAPRSLVRP